VVKIFIRTKKISGKEYAYLVKNIWTKKGTRQKAIGYLGRVNQIPKQSKKSFILNPKDSPKTIVHNLIIHELLNHNFQQKNNQFIYKKIIFNPKDYSFSSRKKQVVLKLNNEYMCQHTLKQLSTFNYFGDEEQVGMALAKAIVTAGLTIPQEAFIHLFEKVYKNEKGQIK